MTSIDCSCCCYSAAAPAAAQAAAFQELRARAPSSLSLSGSRRQQFTFGVGRAGRSGDVPDAPVEREETADGSRRVGRAREQGIDIDTDAIGRFFAATAAAAANRAKSREAAAAAASGTIKAIATEMAAVDTEAIRRFGAAEKTAKQQQQQPPHR